LHCTICVVRLVTTFIFVVIANEELQSANCFLYHRINWNSNHRNRIHAEYFTDSMADKPTLHAQELTPQDYLNKIKDSYQITTKLDTKFFTDEVDKDITLTVEDLIKKKRNAFYWRGCKNSKYKIAPNVTLVKVMIENCSDCTLSFNGPITTNVVEVWRCNNLTLEINTDVFHLPS